jgi:Zn finger protein HypA/HybF involved in hydrogenase expression
MMPEAMYTMLVFCLGVLARDTILRLAKLRIEQHEAQNAAALQQRLETLENQVNGLVLRGKR